MEEDRKFIAIGPRTGKNILKGRIIRKNEMGGDVFEDYWTDSEEESSSSSPKSACKLSEVDTSTDSSKVACEEQQLTVCFDESPTEETSISMEASNSNKMHLEGPVPVSEIPIGSTSPSQNEIAKSHPCNSGKSSINPKYAAKSKLYDELDTQVFNEVDQMSESETENNKSDSVEEIDSSSDERGSESENEEGGVPMTSDFHNSKTSKRGNKSIQIGSLSAAEVAMENMHVSASEEKKKKKKKNQKRSTAEDVRRSGRQRFPPLAKWRNQRLIYTVGDDGLSTITGVEEGNKDDAPIESLRRRQEYQKDWKKKKMESKKPPKSAKLIHTGENKTVAADVVKGFSVIPWQTSNEDAQGVPQPYYIKKMIETENTAFGFIQISVGQEKPHQYMPNHDLHLTLIKGEVEVSIQKNLYRLNVHDMFMVPKDCDYCIKNIGNTKALLSFAVGKFDFI